MSAGTLPLVNACLNGLSAVLLLAGFVLVRHRRLAAHRAPCWIAFPFSLCLPPPFLPPSPLHLFLACK